MLSVAFSRFVFVLAFILKYVVLTAIVCSIQFFFSTAIIYLLNVTGSIDVTSSLAIMGIKLCVSLNVAKTISSLNSNPDNNLCRK